MLLFFFLLSNSCCCLYLRLLFDLVISYLFPVSETATRDVLEKSCSSEFRNIHWKTPTLESLFNKVVGLTRLYEYYEISKNIYFEEHLQTAASRLFLLEWSRVESISLSTLDLDIFNLDRNWNVIILHFLHKQPLEVFCKKNCSYKFRKIHRKASMAESLF